jgi:hypothetical protein
MNRLTNFHILTIKCLGATNTQPSRVKIISDRFKQSQIISFTNDPGASSPTIDSAKEWLQNNGFELIGMGEGKDCYYIITSTFEPLKKKKKVATIGYYK